VIKMTASEVETTITAWLYPPRQCIVVPNISWGFGLAWEADLISVTPAGYATEIEIKVSVSDFRADSKKRKHELIRSSKISSFVYAMPKEIYEKAGVDVPEDYGIILIEPYKSRYLNDERDGHVAKWHRRPKKFNKTKIEGKQITELYRLGYLRMWDAKHVIKKLRSARD